MVLDELVGDRSLDQVRVQYDKLIQALKKSRENEKRLMSKCRELNAEIASNSTKVSAALQLSQHDQTTIASLKRVHLSQHTVHTMLHVLAVLFMILLCHNILDCVDKYYEPPKFSLISL